MPLNTSLSRLRKLSAVIDSFGRDRRGNVAIAFALSVIPCTFVAGAAVDYSGAADLKSRLQSATDGTNLKLCKMAATSTSAQLQSAAATNMTTYMGSRPYTIDSITVTSTPRQIQLTTKATFNTAIVRIMGSNYRTITVAATAKCISDIETFEIALVLDNTGSMDNSSGGMSKLQALQSAATSFVSSIFSDARLGPNTKMSLVPFAAAVAVTPATYRGASWVDTLGKASYHWNLIQGGRTAFVTAAPTATSRFDIFSKLKASVSAWDWNGCFESLPYPLNTQDTAPSASNLDSYYVPMLAADETGDGGDTYPQGTSVTSVNSYIDDANGRSSCPNTTNDAARTGRPCKYLNVTGAKTTNDWGWEVGPNVACTTRPLTRLTSTYSTITGEIALMRAKGATNIHEGFMWGWRTVSPKSVFADGAAYSKVGNNKIVILMTDGENTMYPNGDNYLKSRYSAYGFFQNADGSTISNRLATGTAVPTDSQTSRNAIDALTLAACSNARAAGVTIYTIGFSTASDPIDQQGINMLKTCAGNADQAYVANDSSGIQTVFQQIAASIGGLRLTQ